MIYHLVIFYLFIAVVITFEALLIIRDRKFKSEKSENDKGSRVIAVLATLCAIGLSVLFRIFRIGYYGIESLFWIGVTLSLSGLSFRAYSISVLGKSFSSNITSYSNQKLIMTGPYKVIRHPCYTGLIVMTVGFGLVSESWPALIVLAALIGGSLLYRMHVEERYMVKIFGNEYSEYMNRTKRIIPYLY